jgi:hypothetical protein
MDNDDVLVAYLAGIFDGEGTISTRKRKEKKRRATVRPSVQIKMAWLPTLMKFLERFGGAVRRCHAGIETNKALFQWSLLNHSRQLLFLKTVLPFLGEKRSQAELLIAYLTVRACHPARRMPLEVFDLSQLLHDQLRFEKKKDFADSKPPSPWRAWVPSLLE